MTCKDCIHYEVCMDYTNLKESDFAQNFNETEKLCDYFKNKANFVEVETIKAWLYKMAINNVGCVIEGDFSNACEEIISRLDGLRNFAKERGGEK